MSASAGCWLDNFLIGSTKNEIDPNLIVLFRASDKVVLSAPVQHLPVQLEEYRDMLESNSINRLVYYEAPTDLVRDRLDVMGYTLATSKLAFREWIQREFMISTERLEHWKPREDLAQYFRADIEILSKLTPESWIDSLKIIWDTGLRPKHNVKFKGQPETTLIGYMLSNDWYGFPGYDFYIPIRLAIEAVPTGKNFLYDLTDLVEDGYFDSEKDFVQYGLDISASDYNFKAKTIVLTEGKSDARILKQSLNILYPHLQDYFSFLDFEVSNIGGGVGNLTNMVKAFAGAGIINNVVALFDNDTAAKIACKSLESINLPSNIVVRQLPNLDLLSRYPTIGPSGQVELDINGIAASIELYLGEDVLNVNGKRLMPVQWTGYERTVSQYQGEVLDKGEIHKRFEQKIKHWNGSKGPEWDGLRAIFQVIFSAFDERHRSRICQYPSEIDRQ